MRIGLFTGTFDPFTIGHKSIVDRALPLFDKLIIAVALSNSKNTSSEIEKRVDDIKSIYEGIDNIEVKSYSDLTIDMAKRENAQFIVRGVRSVNDFEYEREQADVNHLLSGIETILLFSEPNLSIVSSSMVRELKSFGKDVSDFLPKKD
ncbi:pantetheine-phosphate adenylyltransferase [Segatella paludivivens]|uniref:pantetheine-phosphate adenylyltransferase n=1 Tax=Segatella paludivivens TaxID=185294 RepID=UPI000376B34C|nr:pantetheine-phosphate adenylyltransferase [Segatella paludivivens]